MFIFASPTSWVLGAAGRAKGTRWGKQWWLCSERRKRLPWETPPPDRRVDVPVLAVLPAGKKQDAVVSWEEKWVWPRDAGRVDGEELWRGELSRWLLT